MAHPNTTDEASSRLDEAQSLAADRRRYDELTPLCLRSLVDSYDHGRSLFSHQLFQGRWCEVDEVYPHETLTSSCIALIGLARAGIDFEAIGIDPEQTIDAVVGEVHRTGYLGGVGLLIWANAVVDGRRDVASLLRDAGSTIEQLSDDLLPSLTTMETAWTASGLLHEVARSGDVETRWAAAAAVTELRTNRYSGSTRLMRHAGSGASAVHRARGHIANFADQIYSVQAFAFAAIVLDDAAAKGVGAALTARHCELQGPLGQWWWHYDAGRGHVALRYAVYSVHQHGMAPMALAAATAATGTDHRSEMSASLRWLDTNELGTSMVDSDRSTVWRSIERVEPAVVSKVRGALEALGASDERDADVVLNQETRPYEWAWCLYAAAIVNDIPKGRSIV